ncbi:MAG: hypothetical protein CM1200mP10_07600 [Candidatus Neomarinimicrobiota bacterium]|nr:MAG: hypothetical protein CM1200mP10_07600 [Candidatus Neomarinimicrobiota bacterium]
MDLATGTIECSVPSSHEADYRNLGESDSWGKIKFHRSLLLTAAIIYNKIVSKSNSSSFNPVN